MKQYSVHYDAGIEWINVGGVWRGLDHGVNTAKWSSDVTIRGSFFAVANIRDGILAATSAGSTISLTCAAYEKVFGPEFDYAHTYVCVVDSSEQPYLTGELNTSVPTEWTFTITAVDYMPSYYLYTPSSMPSSGYVQQVNRFRGTSSANVLTETSTIIQGFGFESPTAEVTYIGSSSIIAQIKTYLQSRRLGKFTLTTPAYWLFTAGSYSEQVTTLAIDDGGQEDMAGINHSCTATYGR